MRKISHWLESYTEAESLDLLVDLATTSAASGGVVGEEIAGLLRRGEFAKLLDFELPYDAMVPECARYCRQALALFQKLEFLEVGIDKRKVALSTFEETEVRCRETNLLFRMWSAGRVSFRSDVERVLFRAQQKIARVLGEVPSVQTLRPRFGPGATTLTKKREASIKRKLDAGLSCSEELAPYAGRLLEELPELVAAHSVLDIEDEDGERSIVPLVIHEGAISFVLKNAKTHRSVETQPVLNGMYQLAIGDYMTERLRRSGLDLHDQTRNREAARRGSVGGALATLDLKSASDLIAIELVAHLLPVDWFNVLFALRTGRTRVQGGNPITLEKMSTMGNGYTFPLESLIFWALSESAVIETSPSKADEVEVYGDDIIVPTESVALVKEVLTSCGFVLNEKKSYWAGPFRESCGADFLSGIDIRPVYVKETITPAVLFTLHNGFTRRGMPQLAAWVRSRIHPALAIVGPDGFGDGHLISDDWERRSKHRSRGFGGWVFSTFARIPKRDFALRNRGDRVLPSYSIYIRGAEKLFERGGRAIPGVQRLFSSSYKTGDWGPAQRRANGATLWPEEPSLPLPAVVAENGEPLPSKATTFPGTDGYKKISIYTLG